MDIDNIPDDILQYMHSNPVFNMEQQRRYEFIMQIEKELAEFKQNFITYTDIGSKLCSQFATLRNQVADMELVCTNESFKNLNEIFKTINSAFVSHFEMVQENITKPLNIFIQKELGQLSNFERDYQKHLDSYISAEDKFVAQGHSTKESTKQQIEQSLIQSHTLSTLSFFDFSMKMESIELQLKSIMPQIFTSFLKSILDPFSEVYKSNERFREFLEETASNSKQIEVMTKDFFSNAARTKQTISSQIPNFWLRINQPFGGTNLMSYQGYLWKKCGRFSVSWIRRFFVVSNCVLSYSNDVESALHKSQHISLLLCSVRPDPNASRPHCFTVVSKERAYIFQALTEYDMNRWLAVIQNNISAQLNSNEGGPIESISDSGYICADCGAPGVHWISLNWGVSMCDECCGVHRSLTSVRSRVRSLKLDEIDPYQRYLIDAIGSEKANMILEKNVVDKLSPKSNREHRIEYIRKKYIDNAFIGISIDDFNIFEMIQNGDLMGVYGWIAAGGLKHQQSAFSPLHAASIVGNPLIVQLIVLNTSNIDIPDDEGWTPLSYSTFYNHIDIINILLSFGSIPSASSVAHPYAIARSIENDILIRLFDPFQIEYTPTQFKPPHQEFTPKPFALDHYIDMPTLEKLVRRKSQKIDPNDKEKLRGALDSMVNRLSSHGSSIQLPYMKPPDGDNK